MFKHKKSANHGGSLYPVTAAHLLWNNHVTMTVLFLLEYLVVMKTDISVTSVVNKYKLST